MTLSRRFAWVLNLDAELELVRLGYNPRARVLEQLAQYGDGSRALLGPRDVVVEADFGRPGEFTGRAWCPTPHALARLRRAGVVPEPHPSVAVIRRVNHRRFAFDLGGGLPDQRYVEERTVLDALISERSRPWLLKRPLAFAGRGQLRVHREGPLSDKESSWIDVSLRDGGMIVEPLVEPMLEVSVHGFVWMNGAYELGRVCVQAVTDRGVFRGVRLAEREELEPGETRALFECAERVAVALRDAGYFGPFGVDAHRHRLGGRVGFCALGEINARYTMGFATGFPRRPSEIVVDAP